MTGPQLLRAWIDKWELTQRQAAARLGVKEAKLSVYLSGKSTPGLITALRIQDVTGIEVRSWALSRLSKMKKRGTQTRETAADLPGRKA